MMIATPLYVHNAVITGGALTLIKAYKMRGFKKLKLTYATTGTETVTFRWDDPLTFAAAMPLLHYTQAPFLEFNVDEACTQTFLNNNQIWIDVVEGMDLIMMSSAAVETHSFTIDAYPDYPWDNPYHTEYNVGLSVVPANNVYAAYEVIGTPAVSEIAGDNQGPPLGVSSVLTDIYLTDWAGGHFTAPQLLMTREGTPAIADQDQAGTTLFNNWSSGDNLLIDTFTKVANPTGTNPVDIWKATLPAGGIRNPNWGNGQVSLVLWDSTGPTFNGTDEYHIIIRGRPMTQSEWRSS